jgi:hypothetical protein
MVSGLVGPDFIVVIVEAEFPVAVKSQEYKNSK